MTHTGSIPRMPRLHPDEKTLRDQVHGILREVLETPGLPEGAKDRLRGLIDQHAEHPERALLEHLHAMREDAEPSQGLLAG